MGRITSDFKPIFESATDLFPVLNPDYKYLYTDTACREFIKPNLPTQSKKATLLVVENDVEINDFIARHLMNDFNIISAKNGLEGLQKASTHQPDLILADTMIPLISGNHLVHVIRKEEALNDTPIILMSTHQNDELHLKLLREGAQDYVRKPFSQDELKARIINLVYLKKAKDEVKQKIVELTHTNEELEAFSRSVSHDLRNPVNAIIGFSSILLKHFRFDSTQEDYLNEIHASAKKMEQLINDLLLLSQTTQHTLHRETINLSVMVKSITTSLKKQYPTIKFDFVIQENVSCLGDSNLIYIALENLLNNACKYTSKTQHARIEFAALDSSTFYIRDNGVGFPQQKANKLFIPFSRLHTDSEFPGTGIGLTTVKRIIDRHNGRVWAESDAETGTTFYVTLPAI